MITVVAGWLVGEGYLLQSEMEAGDDGLSAVPFASPPSPHGGMRRDSKFRLHSSPWSLVCGLWRPCDLGRFGRFGIGRHGPEMRHELH